MLRITFTLLLSLTLVGCLGKVETSTSSSMSAMSAVSEPLSTPPSPVELSYSDETSSAGVICINTAADLSGGCVVQGALYSGINLNSGAPDTPENSDLSLSIVQDSNGVIISASVVAPNGMLVKTGAYTAITSVSFLTSDLVPSFVIYHNGNFIDLANTTLIVKNSQGSYVKVGWDGQQYSAHTGSDGSKTAGFGWAYTAIFN